MKQYSVHSLELVESTNIINMFYASAVGNSLHFDSITERSIIIRNKKNIHISFKHLTLS